MRNTRWLPLLLLLVLGCGSSGGSEADAGAQGTPIEVTEASFDCILDGTKVRSFYVKNLLGDLDASLAVANGEVAPPYPPGTLLQLVPLEAMVKREAGFSPQTNDWEFFFLATDAAGTMIVQRGKDEAENAFGGNCFDCHSLAADNDFVCETDNGCDPLTIDATIIESLQLGDPRCR